jgi:hypothetical protein
MLKETEDTQWDDEGKRIQQKSLTGYRSSEEEKRRNDEPQRIWELSNSYGSLAVGKNKRKQLMIVNSQRRTKEVHQLTPESNVLRRDTSVKIPLITEEFRVNEDWNRREQSAYSFQLDASRSPDYLMRKMKELTDLRQLNVQDNINPFFELSGERDELKYLRERAVEATRVPSEARSREQEMGLRIRIQFLTTALADKERQRLRFYTKLPRLMEEARKEEAGDWRFAVRQSTIWEADAEDEENESEEGTWREIP